MSGIVHELHDGFLAHAAAFNILASSVTEETLNKGTNVAIEFLFGGTLVDIVDSLISLNATSAFQGLL
ncbi:hypothetical protein J5N97_014437 [Dioscorea zingiberensis]|uniref:Uncharacterized protein n=1 Tax=Dioscorea zingiberensis TaxID=325984 RepID=A0A9D5HJS3_9LILI|nr:hypothetical protein J5N97_014437 [Dioscorea zingiberensis]